ncbi:MULTISPECIES: hypothetical protein [Micromonospora]|uniref:Uncharacterized protein n=2 Tax=Micromonospora TaxID=1873 RepID=A0A9X0I1D4_9ACTN|nr:MULTISPECIES: hypothetical protein [Micromonospora]AEB45703.1 hypothetical protein VAB18032_23015 [Micromonospora maris AB-18-032]KUJ45051.1 hypothetical protein ADL17_18190 [Micromonospora maris]MBL6277991.1 hypothetical protein [Micromonospora fiedleri]WSK41101.1 hypothetical protein OG712_21635 [Micromonospora maris]
MTDQHGELDAALERVIEAARHHLAAVRAAQGRIDDDDVWRAYVALNNASFAYDEQLMDAFGEVTPWDVESIDPDEVDQRFAGADGVEPTDPHPQVISVRQRRDYRVPSVSALIRVAEAARREGIPAEEEVPPVEGVGEAVLELLQSGDGSLSALDVPELEPLDGVVMVSEVGTPVDLESFDDDDPVGPFQPAADDRLVGRLDEHPFLDDEAEHAH